MNGYEPLHPSTEFSQSHDNDGIEIKLELMSRYIAAVVSSKSWDDYHNDKQLCEQMYDLATQTIKTYIEKK